MIFFNSCSVDLFCFRCVISFIPLKRRKERKDLILIHLCTTILERWVSLIYLKVRRSKHSQRLGLRLKSLRLYAVFLQIRILYMLIFSIIVMRMPNNICEMLPRSVNPFSKKSHLNSGLFKRLRCKYMVYSILIID